MSWASPQPPPGVQTGSYGYTQSTYSTHHPPHSHHQNDLYRRRYESISENTHPPRLYSATNTDIASHTAATAYTAVPVRTTGFGQPYAPQPQYPNAYAAPANPTQTMNTVPATQEQESQKLDWPDSVRSYVQRSFERKNLLPDVAQDEIKVKLKETITHAKETGIMYTTDWDNMPLPQHLIKAARVQALLGYGSIGNVASVMDHAQAPSTPNPKKRKSSDLTGNNLTTPWRVTSGLTLQDRMTQPANDVRPTIEDSLPAKSKLQKQAEKRQRRFDGGYKSTYRSPTPPPSDGPIVGTATELEKRYLRLTSAPKASLVRPEHILHQTLELLKKKWRKEGNYGYICDQFKSMRQDLTVQRIRNDFTVSVYEIHARIALEKGDLGEYNQCQTQLRALYASGQKGNPIEFKAYRILYFIHTANRTALNDAIADLTTAEKDQRAIKHALSVRSALALGNYHKFFQLYLDVPNMGAYLMDMFVKRERLAALANLCKAYVHHAPTKTIHVHSLT
jgi:hypothetical protein